MLLLFLEWSQEREPIVVAENSQLEGQKVLQETLHIQLFDGAYGG